MCKNHYDHILGVEINHIFSKSAQGALDREADAWEVSVP
jgi:hypothetical protein